MSAADLGLHGWDWVQLAFGLVLWLAPGAAAADRWLKGLPSRWLWAPVFSFTLLALGAILLDFVGLGAVRPTVTTILAFLLSFVIAWPRVVQVVRHLVDPAWTPRLRLRRPTTWTVLRVVGLSVVLAGLFVAHSFPHVDAPVPRQSAEVPRAFLERALLVVAGDDTPEPVHVDEHLHLAHMGAIDRTGKVQPPHPYTGEVQRGGLFTVDGLRSERGWQVGVVQLHQMTGASFPTLAHYLPALWGAYLGLAVWLLLRPAPGALVSAALTAVLPTTPRFLGTGFLVPSAFALPWVLAVMAVAHRGRGPGRLVALALLITGAFFVHIVLGTVALVAGLATALLRPAPWSERAGLVAAMLLPLVWILPPALEDIVSAVTDLNHLPFAVHILRTPGMLVLAGAVAGAAWAWFRSDVATTPHRTMSVLAAGAIVSLAWSIEASHSNDATYGRLIPVFFLAIAVLAGLAVGVLADLALRPVRLPAWARAAAASVLLVGAGVGLLVPALFDRMDEPYYRVFEGDEWDAVAAFVASDAGSDDVFLSHPWEAPVLNALTGAKPYTVLYPGSPPVEGEDYIEYRATGGADAEWLRERGITYVVDVQAPNAPYRQLGPNVYALTP